MTQQLNPQEIFTIPRQLGDPTDSNTNYVQAKVRNVRDDTLRETVNLTDKGDQRFRGDYTVPADVSGQGFFITIETRVYTDSGYTTESKRYYREEFLYLVQERFNPILGKGGGVGVDYKKLRRIIKEEMIEQVEVPKPEKVRPLVKEVKKMRKEMALVVGAIPQPTQQTDLAPLLNAFRTLNESVKNIKIPEQKELDLSAILKAVQNIPQPEKTNFKPIIKTMVGYAKDINIHNKNVEAQNKKFTDNLNKQMGVMTTEIKNFKQVQVSGAIPIIMNPQQAPPAPTPRRRRINI